MTPHRQLIEHDPADGRFGDCFRTCVASILDLHPSEVPHFYATDTETVLHQLAQARAWLRRWGLDLAAFAYFADQMSLEDILGVMGQNCPGLPMILSGGSGLGCNHSVVIMDGAIVSDPSGNGIVGPMDCGQWQVDVITVSADWRGRLITRREGWDQLDRMTEDERRRWIEGRDDWRDSDWQDHCGRSGCEECDREPTPI